MELVRPLDADPLDALRLAARHGPYLKRLTDQFEAELARTPDPFWPAMFEQTLAEIDALAAMAMEPAALKPRLRVLKRRAHLAIAAADLAGKADLGAVTDALTRLADACVRCALTAALAARGLKPIGLFLVALGKMGAGELNYSSDIDLAAFYDPDLFEGGPRGSADAAARVIRDMTALLDEQTADGYVFRTDLRLRPDPRSTPVAVSTRMASLYYESLGQNWERMVWIKARICAGDFSLGRAFQRELTPFVWRRHLDYWAIADIHAIKRMINTSAGLPGLADVAVDLKLAPGGIREIEFFAQTQQLILGGRDQSLRDPTTCGALAALAEAGVIAIETAERLVAAYRTLRAVEHRIQMRADEQTHSLPGDPARRAAIAALCGNDALQAFDAALLALRRQVHADYGDLFAEEDRQREAAESGNLIFTGVDDDPGTVETLTRFGFTEPSAVIETIRGWHHGHMPATRTDRGRQLLTALLPGLLRTMGETGEPDLAFRRFDTFLGGLRSGVQTLSMLLAEPDLLADLVATLALSPRLAALLGAEPERLEALLETATPSRLEIDPGAGFEAAMDEARRYHRDQTFLIGYRLLHGHLDARDAAADWTRLADLVVQAMAAAAEAETMRRFGPPPGRWSISAMGKLGGEEMSAGSDLDLIVIYEPAAEDQGHAQTWFTRFTQRLITALSAPTAEGSLYEVDMRLRPSGRAGPVAVRLSAFEHYQTEQAWTWEHMALTRLRPLAGDGALGKAALSIACRAITSRAGRDTLTADARDMRARLYAERPGEGLWDLKLAPGGLVDIEFVTQLAMLKCGRPELICSNTARALEALPAAGALDPEMAETLLAALRFQEALQQVLRLALGESGERPELSPGLADRLCRSVGATDPDALEAGLMAHKARAAEIARTYLQMPATENAGPSVP